MSVDESESEKNLLKFPGDFQADSKKFLRIFQVESEDSEEGVPRRLCREARATSGNITKQCFWTAIFFMFFLFPWFSFVAHFSFVSFS